MADIEITRVHNMGLAAARAAAAQVADHLGRKFGLKGHWQGNVLHFERPGVSGSLTVDDRDLSLSVALGFLLKAMKGSIESAVREEIDKVLVAPPRAREAKPAKPKPKKAAPRPKGSG
jgi:putative polyhydroxyalkanoate system protein